MTPTVSHQSSQQRQIMSIPMVKSLRSDKTSNLIYTTRSIELSHQDYLQHLLSSELRQPGYSCLSTRSDKAAPFSRGFPEKHNLFV